MNSFPNQPNYQTETKFSSLPRCGIDTKDNHRLQTHDPESKIGRTKPRSLIQLL